MTITALTPSQAGELIEDIKLPCEADMLEVSLIGGGTAFYRYSKGKKTVTIEADPEDIIWAMAELLDNPVRLRQLLLKAETKKTK
jgi:hypothetical protein